MQLENVNHLNCNLNIYIHHLAFMSYVHIDLETFKVIVLIARFVTGLMKRLPCLTVSVGPLSLPL